VFNSLSGHRYCHSGEKKEMSLGKASTRIKAGVKELQSVQGMKSVLKNVGLGAAIGGIVSLVLTYLMLHVFNEAAGGAANTRIEGYSIYPNQTFVGYDDILLIVVTVLLLASKKLWLVVGFFTGWYVSRYMGLYSALGLPTPTP